MKIMKKLLTCMTILIILATLAIVIKDVIVIDSEASDSRFITLYSENEFTIFYDKDTNVEYIRFSKFKMGGGITPLIDKDGKPLLYEDK